MTPPKLPTRGAYKADEVDILSPFTFNRYFS